MTTTSEATAATIVAFYDDDVTSLSTASAPTPLSCGLWDRFPIALLQRHVFGQLSILDLSRICSLNRTCARIWCSSSGTVWETVAAREYPDHRLWRETLALRPATAGGGTAITAAIAAADLEAMRVAATTSADGKRAITEKTMDSYGSTDSLPLVRMRMERSTSGRSSVGVRVVDWRRVCRSMAASRHIFMRNIDEWEVFMFENLAPRATKESEAFTDLVSEAAAAEEKSQPRQTDAKVVVLGQVRPAMPQVVYAAAIARFILNNLTRIDKQALTSYLCVTPRDKYYRGAYLAALANLFNWRGLKFEWALRAWLAILWVPNSSAGLRHMLRAFCAAYCGQHPANAFEGMSDDPAIEASAWRLSLNFIKNDAAYLLAWAMMILSTDRHNPKVINKQDVTTFILNNKGHGLLSDSSLIALYQSIKCTPILWRVPTYNKAGFILIDDGRNWLFQKKYKQVWARLEGNNTLTIWNTAEHAATGVAPLYAFDFKIGASPVLADAIPYTSNTSGPQPTTTTLAPTVVIASSSPASGVADESSSDVAASLDDNESNDTTSSSSSSTTTERTLSRDELTSQLMSTDHSAPMHYALNASDKDSRYCTIALHHNGNRVFNMHLQSMRAFEEWYGIINWTIHARRSGIDRFLPYLATHSMTTPPSAPAAVARTSTAIAS